MTIGRITFTTETKALYPVLLTGVRNGSRELSAANPANGGIDKRGKTGAEIVRLERRIFRALMARTVARDWTDAELEAIAQQHKAAGKPVPTHDEIEKYDKPIELREVPSTLELPIEDFKRMAEYFEAARWDFMAAEEAGKVLDLLDAAEKVDEGGPL